MEGCDGVAVEGGSKRKRAPVKRMTGVNEDFLRRFVWESECGRANVECR